MKTFVNTFFIILFTFTISWSQDSPNREVGIRFNNLDNFDLLFKKKISETTYRRLRLASVGINISGRESQDTRFNIAGNIAAGLEKRKALTNRFNFIYGFEGLLGLSLNRVSDNTSGTYRAGIGAVLGWNYKLNNNITLGAEIIPSLTYSTNFGNDIQTHNISAGFSTSSTSLTATYGF